MSQPQRQPQHVKRTAQVTSHHRELGQFFTPWWSAALLVQRWFSDLTAQDVVIEATCGPGPFLKAIPEHIQAIGVEIDPELAEIARRNTGRPVITGDFTTVALPVRPTAIIGNPPFSTQVIDRLLERCHDVLPAGGRVGWILPAFVLQTPSRVIRYSDCWSLATEMLPRTLFPGLHCPLTFTLFTKDRRALLLGMGLYQEAHDVAGMPKAVAEALRCEPTSWRAAVAHALALLGGRGSLGAIYQVIQPRRPTGNRFWKEKTRQVLQREFHRVGPGEYALQAA